MKKMSAMPQSTSELPNAATGTKTVLPRRFALSLLAVALIGAGTGCQRESAAHTPLTGKHGGKFPGLSKELVAFNLGMRLTEIAAVNVNGADPAKMGRLQGEAAALADMLELDKNSVKPPRPYTGNRTEDLANFLGFLIAPKHPGRELEQQILDKHGRKIVAYYLLAIKAYSGALVYVEHSPSDLTEAAATALEAAGREAELPEACYRECVTALRTANLSHRNLVRSVSTMLERVENLLKASLKK